MNYVRPVHELVERDRENQSGFGHAELVRMMDNAPPPSYESVARIYHKAPDTIKSWWVRDRLEVAQGLKLCDCTGRE